MIPDEPRQDPEDDQRVRGGEPLEVAVGERIQALVVSTEGGIMLSRRLARGAVSDKQLESAYDAGLPVEGKVEREVKGGFECGLSIRGFSDVQKGDQLEVYEIVEVSRTL